MTPDGRSETIDGVLGSDGDRITTGRTPSCGLRSLRHHYDPVGNLVYSDDHAQRPTATYVINGLTVTAERVFTYDSRYQLTAATGRVHNALTRPDFRGDTPTSGSFRGTRRVGLNDGGAVSRYEREYSYDAGGNLLGWSHAPEGALPGNSWNHDKWVSSTSNRSYLADDLDGNPISDPASKFDSKGQLIELPNLRSMHWSATGQLRRVVMIERTAPIIDDDETYDYAADGRRIRKTTRRLVSGNIETTTTVYLDGCELRSIGLTVLIPIPVPAVVILERWSSHLEVSDGRLATLYRWTTDTTERETDDTAVVRTHYHLGSNVGSVALEIDGSGALIAYEEYFPYGGTAFMAGDSVVEMSFRMLRFAGKDQDDATGFSVFQFRYYAHFLGNWVSPDPAGEVDGPNTYWYARNNPATVSDALGLYSEFETFEPESRSEPNYSVAGENYSPASGPVPEEYAVSTRTDEVRAASASPVNLSSRDARAARSTSRREDGSGVAPVRDAGHEADAAYILNSDPFLGIAFDDAGHEADAAYILNSDPFLGISFDDPFGGRGGAAREAAPEQGLPSGRQGDHRGPAVSVASDDDGAGPRHPSEVRPPGGSEGSHSARERDGASTGDRRPEPTLRPERYDLVNLPPLRLSSSPTSSDLAFSLGVPRSEIAIPPPFVPRTRDAVAGWDAGHRQAVGEVAAQLLNQYQSALPGVPIQPADLSGSAFSLVAEARRLDAYRHSPRERMGYYPSSVLGELPNDVDDAEAYNQGFNEGYESTMDDLPADVVAAMHARDLAELEERFEEHDILDTLESLVVSTAQAQGDPQRTGESGESTISTVMANAGFRTLAVQNESGNGFDLFFRYRGFIVFGEVKSSGRLVFRSLSSSQRNFFAYHISVLTRVSDPHGSYSAADQRLARSLLAQIRTGRRVLGLYFGVAGVGTGRVRLSLEAWGRRGRGTRILRGSRVRFQRELRGALRGWFARQARLRPGR